MGDDAKKKVSLITQCSMLLASSWRKDNRGECTISLSYLLEVINAQQKIDFNLYSLYCKCNNQITVEFFARQTHQKLIKQAYIT